MNHSIRHIFGKFWRTGFGLVSALLFIVVTGPAVLADVSLPNRGDGPIMVTVAIYIIDVDRIDTPRQSFDANVYLEYRWHDPRLAHSGPNEIARSLVDVWNPRIQIINQKKVWPTFPNIVEITPEGNVVYRQRIYGSFAQPLSLHDFPFDRQVFTIHLTTAGYQPEEVVLISDPDSKSGIVKNLSVADWEILSWKVTEGTFEPSPGEDPLSGMAFSFEAKRESSYFIIKVIIPLVFIVAMSWVAFWIDPRESGTQISVSITSMLTLIAYRFAVGTDLPRVSYLTRLDYFILASTVLVYATLIEVVITASYAKNDNLSRARVIDRWARWLFPAAFFLVAADSLVFRFWL